MDRLRYSPVRKIVIRAGFNVTCIMRESIEIPTAVLRQAELLTGRSAAAALEHLVWQHGQLVADLRAARRQIHQFDQDQVRLDDLEQNLKEIADEIHRRLA